MPSFNSLGAALAVLQSHLESALTSEGVAAQFAAFGGVDVVLSLSESRPALKVGRPSVVLSASEEPLFSWGAEARRASVRVACEASEFAGALSNVPETLASLVAQIIRDDYAALRDSGLMAAQFRREEDEIEDDENGPVHRANGVLSFNYFAG